MLRNKLYTYGDESSLQLPADQNFGRHMLHKFVQFKDNMAIFDATTDKGLTYEELAQMTVDVALSLARLGVGKGQVVAITSCVRLEYIPTMLGIICAGATYTSTDTSGQATILHRTRLVKPKVLFCTQEAYKGQSDSLRSVGIEQFIVFGDEPQEGATLFKDFLTERCDVEDFAAAPVNGWDDQCVIWYSSGTTGLSKAVPMTHLNLLTKIYTFIDERYYIGKRVVNAFDFHMMDLTCLHAGATVIQYSTDEALDILEVIQKYKVNILQQVPSVIAGLVNSPDLDNYDVSSLESMLSAASPLSPDLLKTVNLRFPNVQDISQIYGCTETGVVCSDVGLMTKKPGSIGCVCPAVVIKVVDITTRVPLGPDQRGEICISGPKVFKGYLGDSSCEHLDEEGFYKTGDAGYYDEDRYFYIVDRIKDMIKYHGYAVAPAELEAVLVQHPAVFEAGVVGAPDEQYFELPTAFVVLRLGAKVTEEELTTYVNDQVAEWMPLAGGVRFVGTLPRGARGKLDRKELRCML